MKNERKGKGFSWQMEDTLDPKYGMSKVIRGFTVDNLDTKGLDQAASHYEEVFIRVRDLLQDKPWCCDNREDVLSICQAVADSLKENLLIRKG